jgi:FAD:protein FMN transferase
MGTVVSFDVRPLPGHENEAIVAIAHARACLQRADAVFSTWKPRSPMSRLRRGEIGLAEAPAEIATVLDRCRAARDISDGWFDPWAMPGGVDPTGLVKGWAADAALTVVMDAPVEAAMVNAGGDIAVAGRPEPGRSWRVGVRSPSDPLSLIAVVEVDGAVATSGTYERGEHIVDPWTRTPASRSVSATVTGPDLGLADALATALVASGPDGIYFVSRADGYEAFVVGPDGSRNATSGFPFA